MNPHIQAIPTTRDSISGDRKRLLVLSLAAVLLVDAGLATMLMDDRDVIARATAIVRETAAPNQVTGLWDHGAARK